MGNEGDDDDNDDGTETFSERKKIGCYYSTLQNRLLLLEDADRNLSKFILIFDEASS